MNYPKIVFCLYNVILTVSEYPLRGYTTTNAVLRIPVSLTIPQIQMKLLDQWYDREHHLDLHWAPQRTYRLRSGRRNMFRNLFGTAVRNAATTLNGAYETYKGLKKVKQQAEKAAVDKLYTIGQQWLGGAGTMLQNLGKWAGKVRDNANMIAQKGVSLMGKTAELTLQVGRAIILPPLRGVERTVNLAHDVKMLGVDLTKKIVQETKDWVGKSWQRVKSVEFPGKNVLVMMYPSGLINIVDYTLQTTWYLTTLAGKTVVAAEAWTLYAALKAVSSVLGPAMRAVGLNCVLMHARNMTIDNPMVDEVRMGVGRVCGWPNMVPVNNVTITRDSGTLLVVHVPYVLEHIDINFKKVSVIALGDKVIDNENMHVHVRKVHVRGEIFFRAGTILRFISIHIRVNRLDGFQIDFGNQKLKSNIMEMLEGMGDFLAENVAKTINQKFIKFENKLSKIILKG